MIDINIFLKEANLYSIEYTGFYSFKVSISNGTSYYKLFTDLIIEFNSGCIIFKNNTKIENCYAFDLYGKNIINSKIEKSDLVLELEDNYKIKSTIENNNILFDRKWCIKSQDDKTYILNDYKKIYFSDNLNNNIENI